MNTTTTPCDAVTAPEPNGRRGFLRLLTALLGAVATTVVGLPLVGYFFGLRKFGTYWVDLGPLAEFPLNETRRLDFDDPAAATVGRHDRTDRAFTFAIKARMRRTRTSSSCSRSTVPTWAAR